MSVLGDIASKSELRVGKDAQDLLNDRKEVEQSGQKLKKEVEKETGPVEQQMKKDEKELDKDKQNVQPELNKADKDLKNVEIPKIPQPTPPPNEMPKKPENPEEVKQPQQQQPPAQKQQEDPTAQKIVDYTKNEIGPASTPIQGQPSAKEVFKKSITNPSSGSGGNLFTPIGQQIRKPAPNPGKVNTNNSKGNNMNNSKENKKSLRG